MTTPIPTRPSARPPARPLNVGVIGCGYATATFHAPLIRAVAGLDLVAVSSSDPAKAAALLPGVTVEADPQALIARPDIDLVVIPTPNDTHHPLAAAALDAGRHVVVDKPFTLTVAQGADLIERARRGGRLLSVFHNRRWDGDFLTLSRLVADGTLGRVVELTSTFERYRPSVPVRWRDQGGPGSGLWYDLGPHLLDQALCLFGMPATLTLDLARLRDGALADDWFQAVLGYERARVILRAGTLVAEPAPRFTAHGTLGSYIKRGLDPQEAAMKSGILPGAPGWGVDPDPGTLTLAGPDSAMEHRPAPALAGDYRHFYTGVRDAILALDGGPPHPNPVPASEALAVMRLIELGLCAAQAGRALTV